MSVQSRPSPYRPREFFRLGDWSIDGHRLKVTGISPPGTSERVRGLLAPARDHAEMILPPAAREEGESSGLGFVILHEGEACTWLLVDWWAHGDILCQRLAMAPHGTTRFQSMDDRPLQACVWEHVVIHHERDAWVRHVMSPEPDADAYLRDTLADGSY